jgi:serine/threonine protein kinase
MVSKRRFFRTMFDEFTIVDQIGRGAVGTVYEVTDGSGQKRAVKALDHAKTSADSLRRFQDEIRFCMQERSKHVVHILDYGTYVDGSPFYVMPRYPRSLRSEIRAGIAPNEVLPLFTQVLNGVEAAHFFKIFHLDLKPENILLDPATRAVVVTDFGMTRFQEAEPDTSTESRDQETLANSYAAPEQRDSGDDVGAATDVYACGLILNEMFTHRIPSGSSAVRIASVAPEFAYLDEIVEGMTQPRPADRIPNIFRVKEELIARGNHFVLQQRLDALKREVVSERPDRCRSGPANRQGGFPRWQPDAEAEPKSERVVVTLLPQHEIVRVEHELQSCERGIQ